MAKTISICNDNEKKYFEIKNIKNIAWIFNDKDGYRMILTTKDNIQYIENCNNNPFILCTYLKEIIYTLNNCCSQCKKCDERTRDRYEICNECCKKRFGE